MKSELLSSNCHSVGQRSGKATVCGVGRTKCEPGAVPKSADCGSLSRSQLVLGMFCHPSCLRLMVLTSYFTTKKDWQRGKYVKPTFSKVQMLGRHFGFAR